MSRKQAEDAEEPAQQVTVLGQSIEPVETLPPTPKWIERRPLPGFGVEPCENRVTAAAQAPSADAVRVADETPEHDWQTGRQWLPDASPHGWPDPA